MPIPTRCSPSPGMDLCGVGTCVTLSDEAQTCSCPSPLVWDNSIFHVASCLNPVVYVALFLATCALALPTLLVGAREVYGQSGDSRTVGVVTLMLVASWWFTGLSIFVEQGFYVGASLMNGLSFFLIVELGTVIWLSFVAPIYKMANLPLDRTQRATRAVRVAAAVTFAGGGIPLAALSRVDDEAFNVLLALALSTGILLFIVLLAAVVRQATRMINVVTLLRNNFAPHSSTHADLDSLLARLRRARALVRPLPLAMVIVVPFPVLALATNTAPFQWIVLFTTLIAYTLIALTAMVLVFRRRAAVRRRTAEIDRQRAELMDQEGL